MVASLTQTTRVASWGNSEAVRIPRSILRATGVSSGDRVEVVVNERNNIELRRKQSEHRCVKPARGITFDGLFAGYSPDASSAASAAWPTEDMAGAEMQAWQR